MSKINLVCPDCRDTLKPFRLGFHCITCDSIFESIGGGIFDLLPKHNKVGNELIYRHPDYYAQFPYLGEIRRYFYTRKLPKLSMSWGHQNIVRLIGKKVIAVSIDLGVGDGDHYSYIESGDDLIGIDYDVDALRRMRQKGIKAPLYRADITRLPFPDHYFDTIRSTYTFEHLYYLEVCLEEIYRTLKDDGKIAISFPIVGGYFMDLLSRLGPQNEFKKRYGLDWKKVLKVEHCNTSRRILEAVERIFVIERIIWSPFGIPSHNLNMFITFRAHKNLEFTRSI